MMGNTVWLVLCHYPGDSEPDDIIGVFTDKAFAEAACRTPMHTMGPFALDVDLGDEREKRAGWLCPQQGLITRVGGTWVPLGTE